MGGACRIAAKMLPRVTVSCSTAYSADFGLTDPRADTYTFNVCGNLDNSLFKQAEYTACNVTYNHPSNLPNERLVSFILQGQCATR